MNTLDEFISEINEQQPDALVEWALSAAERIATLPPVDCERIAVQLSKRGLKPAASRRLMSIVGGFVKDREAAAKAEAKAAAKAAKEAKEAEEKAAKEAKEAEEKAAAKEAKAAEPTPPPLELADDEIVISNRQLDELSAEIMGKIVAANHSNPTDQLVYVRGGALAYIGRDEHKNFVPRFCGAGAVRRIMADSARYVKIVGTRSGPVALNTSPPGDAAEYMLNLPYWPEFDVLNGIAYGPAFAPDGTLHEQRGYDRVLGTYNVCDSPLGDTTPTPENFEAAKLLISDHLLVDFPFQDEASRTHAWSLLLLPFVRPMVAGATPMHLIDAPDVGTGKSLLADLCGIVATGRPVNASQACEDDEEWRKKISTLLLGGASHVFFDNVPTGSALGSNALASALTQEYYNDRLLGSNREINVRVRCVWIASGNNLSPSREIARRSLWIRLDANTESPFERSGFTHEPIRTWAARNRVQLMTAVVTLIRSWVDAGMPQYSGKPVGSFEEWSLVMGGLLNHLGLTEFMGNRDQLFDATVNSHEAVRAFVGAWHARHGITETSTTDLFKIASHPDETGYSETEWLNILEDHLPGTKQHGRVVQLGRILAAHRDRVVAGFKIQSAGKAAGKPRWRLLPMGNEPMESDPDGF